MYFDGQIDVEYGEKIKELLEVDITEESQSDSSEQMIQCDGGMHKETNLQSEDFLEFKMKVLKSLKNDSVFAEFAEKVMFQKWVAN